MVEAATKRDSADSSGTAVDLHHVALSANFPITGPNRCGGRRLWLREVSQVSEQSQDVEMSMLQSEIKSGRKEAARSLAGTAIAIAVATLAILALVGTHVGVIAMVALLVLGSILILNDRSITVEPHIMLT
jgi:hypothetical protein